ncbi:DNA mismatch endonuclease Vsr (plasmid) [Rhizobium acidisoli]|uniref:Very short patch repair endonuclease n=2 Tax=Rhizobium acidisoli TaxID=1538158 RepID=A0AAE5WR81_9HYPH|nr:very short patch repair endonuclease [Rhizobium acidisoli]QAS80995.1 DNA mismatch endonuclease Vsr [Rhizobium acidisoli]
MVNDEPISAVRSKIMASVRQVNTKPEMAVRRVAHALGYRFRINRKDLPGSPDVVFPRRKKVVFVHGCFWHRHAGCKHATTPRTRADFWQEKFRRNKERDALAESKLEAMGWSVVIVWGCETRDAVSLGKKLISFLS